MVHRDGSNKEIMQPNNAEMCSRDSCSQTSAVLEKEKSDVWGEINEFSIRSLALRIEAKACTSKRNPIKRLGSC